MNAALKPRVLAMSAKLCCCCAVFLIGMAGVSAGASAAWFRNTDQEAAHQFKQGEYDAAAETFSDDYNRGVALYRAGRYTDAGEAFSGVEREEVKADALYNLGNTRYKLKDFEGAVEAYEESLTLRADDADTLHNLKLARKKTEQFSAEEMTEEETEEDKEKKEEKQEEKEEKEQQESEESSGEEQKESEESSGEEQKESEESSGEEQQESEESSGRGAAGVRGIVRRAGAGV